MLQSSKTNFLSLFGLFFMIFLFTSCAQVAEQGQAAGQAAPSETAIPQANQGGENSITYPQALGWVNDFGNFMSENDVEYLSKKLKAYEEETGTEVAVITFADFAGRGKMSFQKYLTELGNYWGVGKKDLNNGIIIAVSKHSGESAIVTGNGMQSILTDELCSDIIRRDLLPSVRKEGSGFFDGFNNSFIRIQKILKEHQ